MGTQDTLGWTGSLQIQVHLDSGSALTWKYGLRRCNWLKVLRGDHPGFRVSLYEGNLAS